MASELYERLDGLGDPNDGEDTDTFVRRLEDAARKDTKKATLHRVRWGMALAKEEPAKGEERGVWQETKAAEFGIKARQVRNYIAAGRALAEFRERHPRLASKMPIEILDKPLTSIPRAVKAFRLKKDINARLPSKKRRSPEKIEAERKARLTARLSKLVKDSATLKDGQWVFLRDARDDLAGAYREASRPQADTLTIEEPAFMPVDYFGSKQRKAKRLIQVLARIIPPTGPYAGVLTEPFCGMAAASRYCLQLGLVDRVRLNDRSPLIAAFMTAIIADPEPLKERILAIKGIPDQAHLEELWEHKLEAQQIEPTDYEDDGPFIKGRHLDLDLAYTTVVLLGCSDGKGFILSPKQTIAEKKWNPEKTCRNIDRWHSILAGHVIGNECTFRDAFEVLNEPRDGILLVDPPYLDTEVRDYDRTFDHRGLRRALLRQGLRPWLLTYRDHPTVRELYAAPQFEIAERVTKKVKVKDKKTGEYLKDADGEFVRVEVLDETWITVNQNHELVQARRIDAPATR
jgi:DNA adenine methylase